MTAYVAAWHAIETEALRKYRENFPDVREAFVRLDGLWGSLLVGRALTCFRGARQTTSSMATDSASAIPSATTRTGRPPGTSASVCSANGFAAGIAYATPPIEGLQLTVGYYDPVTADGIAWERTKWGQMQSELTFDRRLGERGKIQAVSPTAAGSSCTSPTTTSTRANVYGVGYGGRLELGPVRLGVAGHRGKGIGIFYAFDFGESVVERAQNTFKFRTFDGHYVQGQVKIRKFDVSAGWGSARMFLLDEDVIPNAVTGEPVDSLPMQQMGFSGGVFYHYTDYLVFGADYFLAQIKWWLGEQQTLQHVQRRHDACCSS